MARFREKYVAAVDDAFARIARTAGGDQAAFRELIDLAPPGIDEVIAVADVAEALTEGKGHYDVIVTDTAPTGHALRLLQTPAVLREWTQALMAILLKYREIVGAGTLASLLVQLSKRLRGLQEILADPAQDALRRRHARGGPAGRRVGEPDRVAAVARHRRAGRHRQRRRRRILPAMPRDVAGGGQGDRAACGGRPTTAVTLSSRHLPRSRRPTAPPR